MKERRVEVTSRKPIEGNMVEKLSRIKVPTLADTLNITRRSTHISEFKGECRFSRTFEKCVDDTLRAVMSLQSFAEKQDGLASFDWLRTSSSNTNFQTSAIESLSGTLALSLGTQSLTHWAHACAVVQTRTGVLPKGFPLFFSFFYLFFCSEADLSRLDRRGTGELIYNLS